MSEAIGPGDYVECVQGDVEHEDEFLKGHVYLVRRVWADGGYCDFCGPAAAGAHPALDIVGHPLRHGTCGCQFRPIYRPKAELIASLKQPSPELEPLRVLEDEVASAAAFLIALIPQVYR